MHDIAREVGLSHVSVSLALSNNPRIPEARRDEIKKIAERMGYRPDPMLTALRHYRHSKRSTPIHAAIAWLNTWPEPAALRKLREFDGYWRGAREVAESCGYRLEEFAPTRGESAYARLEKILLARSIQGILIPPSLQPDLPGPAMLDWNNFSAVCFGHSHDSLPMHVVTADQIGAGRLAFKEVQKRGYRRIGYVSSKQVMSRTFFSAGYLHAQGELSPSRRLPILELDQRHSAKYPEDLLAWFKAKRPDALITDLAETRAVLKELKIKVPQDVGLAALSVLDGNASAGIDQNSEEIGRVAVETLISLMNHPHRGIPLFRRQILVRGFWVDGNTLPKLKTADQIES